MANTAFDHASALTIPGSTTNNGLVRWGDTTGTSFGNITGITSDGSNLSLLTRGEVRFSDADSSHYVAFEAPATVSTTYTMTLPADLPAANEYLKVTSYSGGAGVLEWASVSADTNTTYLTSWVDSSANAILRLTPSSGSADDLTIIAGTNITLTPSGDNLTIDAASGGGVVSGGTNNAVLRADGTGGSTSQGSGVLITDANAVLIGCGSVSLPALAFKCDTDTGFFRDANLIKLAVGGALNTTFTGGSVLVGDTGNGEASQGITINQGAYDDLILTFKSSDVSHGQTGAYEADTFGLFKKLSATCGGMRQVAISDAGYKTAWAVEARVGTACTGSAAASQAAIAFMVVKKCGSGGAVMGACDNLASFHTVNSESGYGVLLVKGDGDIHSQTGVISNSWDSYCDVALLTAARAIQHDEGTDFRNRYSQWIDDYGCILEKTKVISRNLDTGGPAFVSHNGMMGLTVDAIRQLGERVVTLETNLKALTEDK
jgi:hypothetical protein